jgi:DNA-binding transcriptional MerR regulator
MLKPIRYGIDTEISKLNKLTNDYLSYFKNQYTDYKNKDPNSPGDITDLLRIDTEKDQNFTNKNLLIDKKVIQSLEEMIRTVKKADVYIKEIQKIIDKNRTQPLHKLLSASYHNFKHKLDTKTQEIMKPHLYDFETMKKATKTNRTKLNTTKKAKSF